MARPRFLLVFVAALLAGCIDPIDLDVGPPERRLVVTGLLREGPGPHEVLLRRSGAFTQGLGAIRPAEEGARVTVLVGDGTEVVLPMVSPGLYASAPGGLVGEVGQAYGLRIETRDGATYEAVPQVMRAAPAIADFETRVETRAQVVNGTLVEVPQVTLLVRPEPTPGEPTFFRWVWQGVALVEVCPVPNSPACAYCYVPVASRSLVQVGGDSGTASGAPPHRVAAFSTQGAEARYLVQPLYLTVEQQAITPEMHAYLDLIRETAERVGGLFDPPPDAAIGNVLNVADPHDYALGAFVVAGATSRETCLRRTPDRPPLAYPGPLIGTCAAVGSPVPPPGYADACRAD